MIPNSTLKFLKDLKKNNQKEWFDKNRSAYENSREQLKETVGLLIEAIAKFDPAVKSLESKNCLFRINRDVRFSKDKSPYKTNMGAWIGPGGKKSPLAGYYLHLEQGACFIAGGNWMPEAEHLKKIRQEIDYNLSEFTKIVWNKKFIAEFKELDQDMKAINPPKGYDKDQEGIEFIKLKSFIVTKKVSDKDISDPKIFKAIVKDFELMYPLINFLRKAID
jgi:uncharacterized protein (TIGR02453 family)